jgi:deoxyhypusine synthase
MSGQQQPGSAPSAATDAVLVKSAAMPEDSQPVEDFDFDKIKGPVTAEDLLRGMQHMGFQATSIGEAVRIINDMVRTPPCLFLLALNENHPIF